MTFQDVVILLVSQFTLIAKILYAKSRNASNPYALSRNDYIPYAKIPIAQILFSPYMGWLCIKDFPPSVLNFELVQQLGRNRIKTKNKNACNKPHTQTMYFFTQKAPAAMHTRKKQNLNRNRFIFAPILVQKCEKSGPTLKEDLL